MTWTRKGMCWTLREGTEIRATVAQLHEGWGVSGVEGVFGTWLEAAVAAEKAVAGGKWPWDEIDIPLLTPTYMYVAGFLGRISWRGPDTAQWDVERGKWKAAGAVEEASCDHPGLAFERAQAAVEAAIMANLDRLAADALGLDVEEQP